MEYDVLLSLGQSNDMGTFRIHNQAQLDALFPGISIWQTQYWQTYNDGELKYQNQYPKDAFVSRDFIQFWEFQNKWGEDINDVTTSYADRINPEFVNYFVEADVNGRIINSMWYNENSGVNKYPFSWDLSYALQMYKFTGVAQRIAKIAIPGAGFDNKGQNWRVTSTSPKSGDNLYDRMIEVIQDIKAKFIAEGNTIRKWKIPVEQGEANNATAIAIYKADLKEMLDALVLEIGDPTTQIIIRKTALNVNTGDENAGIAQVELASENANIYTWDDYNYPSQSDQGDFNSEDSRVKYFIQKGDAEHISALGLWRIGVALAKWVQENVTGY